MYTYRHAERQQRSNTRHNLYGVDVGIYLYDPLHTGSERLTLLGPTLYLNGSLLNMVGGGGHAHHEILPHVLQICLAVKALARFMDAEGVRRCIYYVGTSIHRLPGLPDVTSLRPPGWPGLDALDGGLTHGVAEREGQFNNPTVFITGVGERDRERERDRDRERDRERETERERQTDSQTERERERGRERQRDRERDRDRQREREGERDRDRQTDKQTEREREGERETERDRERDRQTDRQRERGRERQRDRERQRQTDRERERERERQRQRETETDRQTNRQRETERETDRQTDRQRERERERETERQRERQRQTDRERERERERQRQTDRQRERGRERQRERQRQTDRQRERERERERGREFVSSCLHCIRTTTYKARIIWISKRHNWYKTCDIDLFCIITPVSMCSSVSSWPKLCPSRFVFSYRLGAAISPPWFVF